MLELSLIGFLFGNLVYMLAKTTTSDGHCQAGNPPYQGLPLLWIWPCILDQTSNVKR